jgi:hypothetical protein
MNYLQTTNASATTSGIRAICVPPAWNQIALPPAFCGSYRCHETLEGPVGGQWFA